MPIFLSFFDLVLLVTRHICKGVEPGDGRREAVQSNGCGMSWMSGSCTERSAVSEWVSAEDICMLQWEHYALNEYVDRDCSIFWKRATSERERERLVGEVERVEKCFGDQYEW